MTSHHGVVHFEMAANDPDKLAGFYQQLFGWQIEKMSMDGTDYWGIITGPVDPQTQMPKEPGYIGGGLTKRMSPDQQAMNYVNVEDVDQYVQKAQGLGAKVLMTRMPVPGMGWFANLMDPEGNAFGVWQNDTSAK